MDPLSYWVAHSTYLGSHALYTFIQLRSWISEREAGVARRAGEFFRNLGTIAVGLWTN